MTRSPYRRRLDAMLRSAVADRARRFFDLDVPHDRAYAVDLDRAVARCAERILDDAAADRLLHAARTLDASRAATLTAEERYAAASLIPTPAQADRLLALALAEPDDIDAPAVHRRLWEHEEVVAYSVGEGILADEHDDWRTPNTYDGEALAVARRHLDDREHGARLAALVLAGYCGIPAEAVR